MHETAVKALVRKYFYQQFLPNNLGSAQIQSCNYLVLLGDNTQEEQLITAHGVPGEHIYSVEHDPTVYLGQAFRARQKLLTSAIYFGELSEFIVHYLQKNQRLAVLNLDICGSYKRSIDPVMTNILQFARQNPQTIVATYSNAGRDRPQLLEGIKSLAICYWLLPDLTLSFVNKLYSRYQTAGVSDKVNFNMILRHLFWLRSQMEHTMIGYITHHQKYVERAQNFISRADQAWDNVIKILPRPMTYMDLLTAIRMQHPPLGSPHLMDLELESITLATYGTSHFYHMGWFTKYAPVKPMPPREWYRASLIAMLSEPLQYTDYSMTTLTGFTSSDVEVPCDLVIWTPHGRIDSGRKLIWPLDLPSKVVETPEKVARKIDKKPSPPASNIPEDVIKQIRELAAENRTIDTHGVINLLDLGAYPKQSITSHIAHGRRSNRT